MSAAHTDVKGQAGAYVLGSLEADERTAFEAHLATCAECAAEVRSLRGVADALAHAVPSRTPRPELRARVLGAFAAQGPRAAASVARERPGWLPLAAVLVLTLGVGAYAARLQTRVTDLEDRLAQALLQAAVADRAAADARQATSDLQSAMGVLAAPDVARIDLAGQPAAPQASARALWSRARGMVFTASNLPPLPAGRVYQVWVVTAQGPVSAGLLTPDAAGGGTVYFSTPPDIPAPTAVAVTLEPAGGLSAPTGAFYLMGLPA
ncbi:MAG: anti-sigma factor [Acidobacteria bacterium]|nr:anti-sigma factor [Acidobacteriota bacterium]